MSNRQKRILLLDDDSDLVNACAIALKKDYCIVKTSSPFEAISFVDAGRDMIDLIICDYSMPGMNGVEFAKKIHDLGVKIPVILYTGMTFDENFHKEHGEFIKILSKPFGGEELRKEVSSVLSKGSYDKNLYKKFLPIIPVLDLSMSSLEKFLTNRGLVNLEKNTPEEVMKLFGPGDGYNIFLSWYYLHDLKAKINS